MKLNQWSSIYNLSHSYSSINSNIKCVGSTIKCVGFKPIDYVINLDVISSFMVFNNFDSMFLSMNCEFEPIKLFKKIN